MQMRCGLGAAMRGALGVGARNPATRTRARDHLIAAGLYSQMLYQLSYSRLAQEGTDCNKGAQQVISQKIQSHRNCGA